MFFDNTNSLTTIDIIFGLAITLSTCCMMIYVHGTQKKKEIESERIAQEEARTSNQILSKILDTKQQIAEERQKLIEIYNEGYKDYPDTTKYNKLRNPVTNEAKNYVAGWAAKQAEFLSAEKRKQELEALGIHEG